MPFVKENASLKDRNTFGINVKANKYIRFSSRNELILFVKKSKLVNQKWIALGGGSNIVFTKDFNGLVIGVDIKGIKEFDDKAGSVKLKVSAGEDWDDFVNYCVDKGYSGVENLSGIPGMVGASPVQNIGAYGVEVKDTIVSVEYIDINDNEIKTLDNKSCNFSYRSSVFKTDLLGKCIILSVTFKLSKNTIDLNLTYGNLKDEFDRTGKDYSISSLREVIIDIRNRKIPNPEKKGNAGSFFKNPVVEKEKFIKIKERYGEVPNYDVNGMVKIPAAWLIDKSGLKGKAIGDVQVYDKQPLILINRGKAKPEDVKKLKEYIVKQVNDKFDISLEPEVRLVN